MSRLPSSSVDSTPPRRRPHHHTISDDPHLQVLGRDGRDLPFSSLECTNEERAHSLNSSSQKRHWWDEMAKRFTHTNEEEETEAPFVSLVESGGEETKKGEPKRVSTDTANTPLQEPLTSSDMKKTASSLSTRAVSLLTTRSTTADSPNSSSSTHYSNALQEPSLTREDEILHESSFFYRDLDEVLTRKPSHSGSIVLPPSQRSAYRARYQQLNQEYIVEDDLDLWEEDALRPPPQTIIQDFSNSSLYYKQDGRVLMKLPKDKVRLVMDPELGEPGILSACITSSNNKKKIDATTIMDAPHTEISYVLTVPPDIYRKVVLELAHAHTTTCSSCFESEDKVSIQVAIGLLCVILTLLFINVIIYPGD